MLSWSASYVNGSTNTQGGPGWGHRKAVIVTDRVSLVTSTGTMTSGRMTVKGIPHA